MWMLAPLVAPSSSHRLSAMQVPRLLTAVALLGGMLVLAGAAPAAHDVTIFGSEAGLSVDVLATGKISAAAIEFTPQTQNAPPFASVTLEVPRDFPVDVAQPTGKQVGTVLLGLLDTSGGGAISLASVDLSVADPAAVAADA